MFHLHQVFVFVSRQKVTLLILVKQHPVFSKTVVVRAQDLSYILYFVISEFSPQTRMCPVT